jgi:hypothetical protein
MNLKNVTSGFLAALQYFPVVLAAVPAIEAAYPTAPGTTKKEAAMSLVAAAAAIGETIPEPHVQVISALIDAVVAALNKSGWFAPKPVVAKA